MDKKLSEKNRNTLLAVIFIILCGIILALGLRGLSGNPTSEELNSRIWKEDGPFELSPERGRYTLLYSVIEDKSLQFSRSLARFVTPDLSITPDGQFVSMFAPGLSFLIIPGYIAGKYLGAAPVGAFAVIAVFALLNIILIVKIAVQLGANKIAASLGALTFAFATPAFAYAVTLYQHHISTFFILLSIYALWRWRNWWSVSLVWFLCALAIVVDNPNFFLMLPIGIYALGRIIILKKESLGTRVKVKLFGFLTLLIMIIPLGCFLWFNQASHGNPWQFPGTLPGIEKLDKSSSLLKEDPAVSQNPDNGANLPKEKRAMGFFETRNLLNGFYIHLLSPDRGIIRFTPVILLGIWGLTLLYRRNKKAANLLVAIIGVNLLIYSMWGDPYGGWAFGSRYLIPGYAALAIGLTFVFTQGRKNIAILFIFLTLFSYSTWVNTLGAVTSNANPPKVEVLALEEITGQEEKYTYERNRDYLEQRGSKSFIWRVYLKDTLTARLYHKLIVGFIMAIAIFLLLNLWVSNDKEKSQL